MRPAEPTAAARAARPRPPRVYAIADAGALGASTTPGLAAAVAAMAGAGVRWIQVRAKQLAGRVLHAELAAICAAETREGEGPAIWIDDRVDLAAIFPLAGVHLGQHDLPPAAARRVLGERAWIGLSTHDEAQLRAADADPDVDVVALGPIFPTRSKERPDPVVGLEGLARLRPLTGKPLVAIGGIDAANLAAVLAAGADSVAVIGAACRGDVAASCGALLAAAAAAPAR